MKHEKNVNSDAIIVVNVNVIPLGKSDKSLDIGTHTFKIPIDSKDLPIRVIVESEKEREGQLNTRSWIAEAICKD